MTKKLFVLISNGGDGSYASRFTFNEEWINTQNRKSDNDELDWEDIGCDGDGFHYCVLTVPEECTLESLGISYDCAEEK